ncbi:MAG: tetratricopeptide repeat protein [Campylobacterota bacterium]|nr:tetratricopeptide repeat protein [Campylobacterota bacterium]
MTGLFIEFRDPLFGVIVFFVLIFIVAIFSYWWGRYKLKEDDKTLDRFAAQFHKLPSEKELKSLISEGGLSEKSWMLLAHTYEKEGDFEKAIEIYQALIEFQKESSERRDTMLQLGRAYFKAGFLERSKEIFLQILKSHPRTPQALEQLLLVYEYLQEYTHALEVLEPLEELGMDAGKDKLYLKAISLMRSTKMDYDEKNAILIHEYEAHHKLSYLIYEYLFRHDATMAWKHLDQSQCERISDILWQLPEENLDLDIIASNGFLRELFTAKGVVDLAQWSSIFELDVLIKLRHANEKGATLQFEYLCQECKQVFPFAFHRCPSCHSIDSIMCETLLTKDIIEENHSFQ